MTDEQIKLLEITVAKGIQEFRDDDLIPFTVFISKSYPEIHSIDGLEVVQTWLLEPDKVIIVTKEFFEQDNPWKYDFNINLEDQ